MKKFINQLKNEINNFKFGPISAELKDLTIIKYVLVKEILESAENFLLYTFAWAEVFGVAESFDSLLFLL